jgi:hypothetical protein
MICGRTARLKSGPDTNLIVAIPGGRETRGERFAQSRVSKSRPGPARPAKPSLRGSSRGHCASYSAQLKLSPFKTSRTARLKSGPDTNLIVAIPGRREARGERFAQSRVSEARPGGSQASKTIPPWLKPRSLCELFGTAEAEPFQNKSGAEARMIWGLYGATKVVPCYKSGRGPHFFVSGEVGP